MFKIMWVTASLSYITQLFSFAKVGGIAPAVLTATVGTAGLSWMTIFTSFYKDVSPKQVAILVLLQGGFFCFYSIFVFGNFFTGLQASRHEAMEKNRKEGKATTGVKFIRTDFLWKTIWKSFGIYMFTSVLAFLGIVMTGMEMTIMFWGIVWFLIAFWTLGVGYEYHSIGENMERRFGKKPRIFQFFDRVTVVVENLILRKLDNSVDIEEPNSEPPTSVSE